MRFLLLCLLTASVSMRAADLPAERRPTVVSIVGDEFFINGQPTYPGRSWRGHKLQGLLMNARLVQGIFDDRNTNTVFAWSYPDTGRWDPERNTREFIAAMPAWRRQGLLAFTINLQGGSPRGYISAQPWHNSAFEEDGSLRADDAGRLAQILDRADELGMVVILGYFYFGQDERLRDEAAVLTAVDNATGWVLDHGWRNVLIEINNECNVRYDHPILQPGRVSELIRRVQNARRDGRRLLVSTSYGGGTVPQENVVRAADFLLLHGNGVADPQKIGEMVRRTRAVPGYSPKPILFNEDDHYEFGKPENNFTAAVASYASWGLYDQGTNNYADGFQSPPVNWGTHTPRKEAFFGLLSEMTGASSSVAAPSPAPYPDRLRWWADGRFGVFIHWGPVSLKGTEISWSRANTNPKCPNQGEIPASLYDHLYEEFNPTHFDAAQWVATIKAAGAKYLVLTAKHCDGFLLWHSRASDYNMAATPFKRDICAELARAARAQNIKIGWYFSPMDWRDPDFRTERQAAFLTRMQAELRELLTQYGPIDLVWFDWDGREALYDQARTYALVKQLQPNAIINNRLDLSIGNNDRQILSPHADYYTPEQLVGAYDDQRPWESCMTTSRKNQWAWGGSQDGVKSFETCLDMLIRCAGGDGNMLLNIGPMPTGDIAPEQAALLRQVGAWLGRWGQSIYGTRGGPFKPGEYGVSTRKGNTIYLHVLEWSDDTLRLPAIAAHVVRGDVLSGGRAEVRQNQAALEISVAERDRQSVDTIVALELDRPALDLGAVNVPVPTSLTLQAKVSASNVFRHQAEFGPEKAIDGNVETRWATDGGTKSAWLEVDFGKPTTFRRAVIRQAYPELDRVRKFAIEAWENGQWKACYRGERLGARCAVRFDPVTAQRVRLNITEATDGPTIGEFQLFN